MTEDQRAMVEVLRRHAIGVAAASASPALRGITISCSFRPAVVRWRGYFERDPTEPERAQFRDGAADLAGDWPGIERVEEEVVVVAPSAPIERLEFWAYLRPGEPVAADPGGTPNPPL